LFWEIIGKVIKHVRIKTIVFFIGRPLSSLPKKSYGNISPNATCFGDE
jgi:hypothetical protein